MIQMLRHEATSGQMDDLAHVVSVDMMADVLTKIDCPSGLKALKEAVDTGIIPNADAQPNFRESLRSKHKAFLCGWIGKTITELPGERKPVSFRIQSDEVRTFCGIDIQQEWQAYLDHWRNPNFASFEPGWYNVEYGAREISNCPPDSC